MRMKIKLQTVIDAIEQASDAYTMLYDTKTNETVYLPDVWITGETDEDLAELIEKEPERFLRFPTKYEIHEYSIMDSFVDDLPAGRIKSELAGAIRGKGAFRRFKQTIRFQGVEQLWYDYQANAYSIAGGNPCKLIRKRFDDDLTAYLLNLKWWDWDADKIFRNMDALCSGNLQKIKHISE